MNQFFSNYKQLLLKNKLFLIGNFAAIAIFWTACFVTLNNIISLICAIYPIIIFVACFIIFVQKVKQEIDDKNKQFFNQLKEEEAQLIFWSKECEKAMREYEQAEKEFRNQDAEIALKHYKDAMTRYVTEFKQIAEKRGMKVKIIKHSADNFDQDDTYFK